jgi:SAM-dependent methyltransferase
MDIAVPSTPESSSDTTTTKPTSSGEPLKLDVGCGPKKQDGHVGIDRIKFPGVDLVLDVGKRALPYAAGSVKAIYCSHFLEHLTAVERIFCLNQWWRVLETGGKVSLTVPHWSSCRAYGDPTHQWPPIGEFFFMYLNKEWRLKEAPHTDAAHWVKGYACDFEATWGYGLNPSPEISQRAQEQQVFAVNHYKEAVFEVQATLTRRG